MNQDKISKTIKEIRKNNNLTQRDLAEKLGVTYQAVSKWENGYNIPDIEILKKICSEYNIDINDLLENKIVKKKNKIIPIIIAILVLIVGGLLFIFIRNDNSFQMLRIKSNTEDFKITGSLAYDSKGKIYIYISDIDYSSNSDDKVYKDIKATLYENYKNKNTKIKDCEHEEHDVTIKDHLEKVTFNVDDYKSDCDDLTKSNLYIEIAATDEEGKTTYYKIPLELEELCPEEK